MLRLLAVLAALVTPAPFLLAADAEDRPGEAGSDPAPSREDAKMSFALALPAPDSWVAIPLTASGKVDLAGWTDEPSGVPGSHQAHGILLLSVEQGDVGGLSGGGGGLVSRVFEVNVQGQRILCCEQSFASSFDGGESAFTISIEDGATLWITFIGINLDPKEPFRVKLAAFGGALTAGEPRAGTDVWAHDLVDESYGAGTSVRLAARTLVGTPAPIERSFVPQKNGFAMVSYWVHDDESLDLTFDVGDERRLDVVRARDENGMSLALGGASYDVTFLAREEGRSSLSQPPFPFASLLFADIDVPGAYEQTYRWPNSG